MVQAASGAYGSLPLGGETRKPSARTQNNYLVRFRTISPHHDTHRLPRAVATEGAGRWCLQKAYWRRASRCT
jgi:hypothetical protein